MKNGEQSVSKEIPIGSNILTFRESSQCTYAKDYYYLIWIKETKIIDNVGLTLKSSSYPTKRFQVKILSFDK